MVCLYFQGMDHTLDGLCQLKAGDGFAFRAFPYIDWVRNILNCILSLKYLTLSVCISVPVCLSISLTVYTSKCQCICICLSV